DRSLSSNELAPPGLTVSHALWRRTAAQWWGVGNHRRRPPALDLVRKGSNPASSGALHRIIVAVELARTPAVEGDRLHRLILARPEPRQHLQHFVLPDIDGDRKGHPRLRHMRAVAGLPDAV